MPGVQLTRKRTRVSPPLGRVALKSRSARRGSLETALSALTNVAWLLGVSEGCFLSTTMVLPTILRMRKWEAFWVFMASMSANAAGVSVGLA